MARPEVTGRAGPAAADRPPIERAAYSIREFCEAHRISESFYFKIRALGLGPRESRTLEKVLITNEAARDWRASREIEPA
jgi:hypothetical protein